MIEKPAMKKTPTLAAIIRAVASSTAIETGQSVAQLENKLKQKSGKFQHLTLARVVPPRI